MTPEQMFKLSRAIKLIQETLDKQNYNNNFVVTRLLLAGDYCREVTEELRDEKAKC